MRIALVRHAGMLIEFCSGHAAEELLQQFGMRIIVIDPLQVNRKPTRLGAWSIEKHAANSFLQALQAGFTERTEMSDDV